MFRLEEEDAERSEQQTEEEAAEKGNRKEGEEEGEDGEKSRSERDGRSDGHGCQSINGAVGSSVLISVAVGLRSGFEPATVLIAATYALSSR